VSVTIVPDPGEAELREAAALHCILLPGSAISRFGQSYARSFYRYAARSRDEIVFAAVDRNVVLAAAVVSLRPLDLQRRLLVHTPLLPQMVLHPLTAYNILRDRLFGRVEDNVDVTIPEVIAIFTATAQQRRGLGAQLLRAIEKELSARGLSRYALRTKDTADNRAIGFYDKQGFIVVGDAQTSHGRFRIMTKRIGIKD